MSFQKEFSSCVRWTQPRATVVLPMTSMMKLGSWKGNWLKRGGLTALNLPEIKV